MSVFRDVDGDWHDKVLSRKGVDTLATIASHDLKGHVAVVAESAKAAEAAKPR